MNPAMNPFTEPTMYRPIKLRIALQNGDLRPATDFDAVEVHEMAQYEDDLTPASDGETVTAYSVFVHDATMGGVCCVADFYLEKLGGEKAAAEHANNLALSLSDVILAATPTLQADYVLGKPHKQPTLVRPRPDPAPGLSHEERLAKLRDKGYEIKDGPDGGIYWQTADGETGTDFLHEEDVVHEALRHMIEREAIVRAGIAELAENGFVIKYWNNKTSFAADDPYTREDLDSNGVIETVMIADDGSGTPDDALHAYFWEWHGEASSEDFATLAAAVESAQHTTGCSNAFVGQIKADMKVLTDNGYTIKYWLNKTPFDLTDSLTVAESTGLVRTLRIRDGAAIPLDSRLCFFWEHNGARSPDKFISIGRVVESAWQDLERNAHRASPTDDDAPAPGM